MNQKPYPQSPTDWQNAIRDALGLDPEEGRTAYTAGRFPYDRLETWIANEFSKGFSPEFVPALVRNLRGLAAWVYADGPEPYWPGADED